MFAPMPPEFTERPIGATRSPQKAPGQGQQPPNPTKWRTFRLPWSDQAKNPRLQPGALALGGSSSDRIVRPCPADAPDFRKEFGLARPRFRAHARDAMKLRKITYREVKTLLRSQSVVSSPAMDGANGEAREWVRGQVEGRRLKVLVTKTDPQWVVTVASPDE